jgi:hydrogenase maturation protein HypF
MEVNKGFPTIGVILPYSPVHHLIMDRLSTPAIVFTSANLKGQPLIGDNYSSTRLFQMGFGDALLKHNLEIEHRQDDSIVKVAGNKTIILRRSRGYVPEPVVLKYQTEGILATGADLKNAFCIGKGHRAIMSQYTGDLENYDVYTYFQDSIAEFERLFHFTPEIITCDSHPNYYSTRYAERRSEESWKSTGQPSLLHVQHHHAHIASVMAEHQLDEKVIGVAMDGTGFGEDGRIWGSEFFLADLQQFERCYHLDYIPLPGGEKSIHEPWRIAAAILFRLYGKESLDLPIDFCKQIEAARRARIIKAVKNEVNIAESCGMGRLFDAVASMINLVHVAGFDGEGPVKMENLITPSEKCYPVLLKNSVFSYESMIREVVRDLINGLPAGEIAARFHNTIVKMIIAGVKKLHETTGINKAVLSGGTFQNSYLLSHLLQDLTNLGLKVFINERVPSNDGGIALGQLAIASKKIRSCA